MDLFSYEQYLAHYRYPGNANWGLALIFSLGSTGFLSGLTFALQLHRVAARVLTLYLKINFDLQEILELNE